MLKSAIQIAPFPSRVALDTGQWTLDTGHWPAQAEQRPLPAKEPARGSQTQRVVPFPEAGDTTQCTAFSSQLQAARDAGVVVVASGSWLVADTVQCAVLSAQCSQLNTLLQDDRWVSPAAAVEAPTGQGHRGLTHKARSTNIARTINHFFHVYCIWSCR